MVEIIRRLIIAGISIGVIAGNSDRITKLYDDTVAVSRQIATAGDMRSISIMLDYAYLKKGRLPPADHFAEWLADNFKENDLKALQADHWGNPLVYEVSGNRKIYTLISAGPDGIPGTEDDIKKTGP
jgi:general secretion pathway protein G